MKKNVLILMFLGFGGIAAIGATSLLGNGNGEVAAPETGPVVIPNDFTDIKTPLTAENCHVDQWPKHLIPPEVVTDLSMLEGKYSRYRLTKYNPITIDQIADLSEFEELKIPPGHIVVAINVKEDSTISGLLKPGQQVDIIGVVEAPKVKGDNRRRKIAKTFLKAIRVYSIDGDRDGSADANQSRRTRSVVGVLVTERQAEQIVLVQSAGELKITLRGEYTDEDNAPEFADIFPWMINKDEANVPAPIIEEPSEDDMFQMVIFNGPEDVQAHSFDADGRLQGGSGSRIGLRKPTGSSSKASSASEDDFGDEGDFSDDLEEDEYTSE